jgi:hypothetical protein
MWYTATLLQYFTSAFKIETVDAAAFTYSSAGRKGTSQSFLIPTILQCSPEKKETI